MWRGKILDRVAREGNERLSHEDTIGGNAFQEAGVTRTGMKGLEANNRR